MSFLFTDIEGSTQLLHALGDEYGVVLADHRRLLRAAVAAHGGVEVDTQGDAFLCAFPSADGAVAAAADAQLAFAAHTWPAGVQMKVRMGVHTGTPTLTGDGYVGIDVHKGARVMACGHGGQVLLSAAARTALDGSADPHGVDLVALGEHRLKDLTAPEPLFQLVIPGLTAVFPPLKALLNVSLPVQATALIGRQRELGELTALLAACRLVTLTGPGGTGKSRLALQAGAELADGYPAGVHFVPLAALTDPQLVPSAIAQVLGVKETPGRTLTDALVDHLRERELLLIIDNLEHLPAAALLLGRLLETGAQLKLLATSREPLHLRGEQEYPVPALADSEALALFAERARQIKPSFRLEDDRPAVEAICRRLDRLPLAIELAAARIRLLPPAKLLDRLQERLPLLTGGAHDAPERQRTLRATIEWSHGLLTAQEQTLFARMSVFTGGATLDAAEDVAGADFDTLTSLVEKNLIRQSETGAGEPRFTMLETIREFATEQILEYGLLELTRGRHAGHYAGLTSGAATGLWTDHDMWMAIFDTEMDNVRAALDWTFTADPSVARRILTDMGDYWRMSGAYAEGGRLLTRAIDATSDETAEGAPLRAFLADLEAGQGNFTGSVLRMPSVLALLYGLGDLAAYAVGCKAAANALTARGEYNEAITVLESGVDAARRKGLPLLVVHALSLLGGIYAESGDANKAMQVLTEAEALLPTEGAAFYRETVVINLAWAAVQSGRYQLAMDQLSAARIEGEVSDRQLGTQLAVALNLGWAAIGCGDMTAALAHSVDGVALSDRFGSNTGVAEGLVALGCAAAGLGEGRLAAAAFGASNRVLEESGTEFAPYVVRRKAEFEAMIDATRLHGQDRDHTHDVQQVLALATSVLASRSTG